jgi:hypothetical protein
MAFQWRCAFCGHWTTITDSNAEVSVHRFTRPNKIGHLITRTGLITCPNPQCREFELSFFLGLPEAATNVASHPRHLEMADLIKQWRLVPSSRAKPLPEFVPPSIRADYEEACAIEVLSPKASATLARRCVQGIIRNYFGISEKTLNLEIQAIKSKVSNEVWEAVDALRKVGNIGAHPEGDINLIIDVEPEEAAMLIRLIELLIEETYVARERQQRELAEVKKLAAEKGALRDNPTAP